MNAPLYTTEILRLAASLAEPAALPRVDGEAIDRSPTCGSTVRSWVMVDDQSRISALSQHVQACAFGQASAALLAASAAGRSREDIAAALGELEQWLGGEHRASCSWPGADALAPARSRKSRHGAILLPFRSLLAAMDRASR